MGFFGRRACPANIKPQPPKNSKNAKTQQNSLLRAIQPVKIEPALGNDFNGLLSCGERVLWDYLVAEPGPPSSKSNRSKPPGLGSPLKWTPGLWKLLPPISAPTVRKHLTTAHDHGPARCTVQYETII